eukprot:4663803-Pyramimonas_sp.AAC.1
MASFLRVKCTACVAAIGRGPREVCNKKVTNNGHDALNRIRDGKCPCYHGPPRAAIEAAQACVVRGIHVQERLAAA